MSERTSIYEAQFSTDKPGTADKSESLLTTVHWPRVKAIAATMMSIDCMGRPMRRSSAAIRSCSKKPPSQQWPKLPGRQRSVQAMHITVAGSALLDAIGQLRQHRKPDVDSVSSCRFFASAFENSPSAVNEIPGNSGVQQKARHGHIFLSLSECSLNCVFSHCLRACRSACHAVRS